MQHNTDERFSHVIKTAFQLKTHFMCIFFVFRLKPPDKADIFFRAPKLGAFAPTKDSDDRQSHGSMEDIPFMALLQQPVEKMEGTSSSGASAGQTSDMDSGDGTVEMDPTSRSTASSNKSTASPKSTGSPTPGSQPGSMPDDYVMVELVSVNVSV